MLQLAGKLSEKPYYIEAINMDVYSLEEINYFIYNHMNLVYRDFFCGSLFDYIEYELGQRALAGQLRVMDKAGSGVRDFISYILSESGYYDADELGKVFGFVMNMDNISNPQRRRVDADNLFKKEKYYAARSIYLEILRDRSKEENDEFYADVAFFAGLCCANLFLEKNALSCFERAYDIFPKKDYAMAYVYVSLIEEDDRELLNAIRKYHFSDEELSDMKNKVKLMSERIRNSEDYKEFAREIEDEDAAIRAAESLKDKYYRVTE